MKQPSKVICIGGANVDRKYVLENAAHMATSNPVSSIVSVGGVARNVAENLGRLGHNVKLLSMAGDDADWRYIAAASAAYMSTDLTQMHASLTTGQYSAILQPSGELLIAVADMNIYSALTPEHLARYQIELKHADYLMMDLNCPAESIDAIRRLAIENHIDLAVVGVSAPKMYRLGQDLQGIHWLILNRDEASEYLQHSLDSEVDWCAAVHACLQRGAQHVAITGGAAGVMAGNAQNVQYFPAKLLPEVVDVTGAGDAFSAVLIHSELLGEPFDKAMRMAMLNAAKTLQSASTVRHELSAQQLQQEMNELITGEVTQCNL